MWCGEDPTGTQICLSFGGDGSFSITTEGVDVLPQDDPAGRVEHFEVAEVNPKQLYLKFIKRDELLGKVPFAIYKFQKGKLVLCDAREYQRTIGGFSIGESRYEFPTDFSGGSCYSLERP